MKYCKGTLTSGRFTGFHCGNALPCRIHAEDEIRAIAGALQARGPDEYPFGFYLHVAEDLYVNGVRSVRSFDSSRDLEEE